MRSELLTMKLVQSTQKNVRFIFCPNPVTVDKSLEWGEGNLQVAKEYAFLKLKNDGFTVANLVQSNKSKSAPVGWIRSSEIDEIGFFNKKPILVDDSTIYQPGESVELETLDGKMKYSFDKSFVIVYNSTDEGELDQKDCWAMTLENLKKNYDYS